MACQNSCNNNAPTTKPNNIGYVTIIVLYILLAIILGSFIIY